MSKISSGAPGVSPIFKWATIVLAILLCASGWYTYKYYRIYNFERAYFKRAEKFYNGGMGVTSYPVPSEEAKRYISNYRADHALSDRIKSVWIDDTTIYHFAYTLYHDRGKYKADGIRFYLEEYDKTVNRPDGKPAFKNGDINLAAVITQNINGQHVDWYSDNGFSFFLKDKATLLTGDGPNIDNYNDPCPPSTTNCGGLDPQP